jgi:hypothetical protein
MKMGQHHTQAAYIGRYHGITNINKKPGRDIPIRIIETKEILNLKEIIFSKNELRDKIKSLVITRAAEKIFSGTFLLKEIENKEKIGLLEDQFIANCDKYSFEDLFSSKSDGFKLTMNYFSLHEARNLENFSFVRKEIINLLNSNRSIQEFIDNTYFFNYLKNDLQKKFVEDKLSELKTPKIIKNDQLFEKKIKEIFNFLYIIVWKKLNIDFTRRSWMVIELGTGLGMGNNLVLNLKKTLYKNYKNIAADYYLSPEIKEILDESIIIFLGSNKIALGYLPKIVKIPEIKPFPLEKFIKEYDFIHRFITSLCLSHSYKQIIISDDSQLEFLLNAFTLDFKSLIKGIEETNIILG